MDWGPATPQLVDSQQPMRIVHFAGFLLVLFVVIRTLPGHSLVTHSLILSHAGAHRSARALWAAQKWWGGGWLLGLGGTESPLSVLRKGAQHPS